MFAALSPAIHRRVVVNQQPTILILRSDDQPIVREIDSNMAGHMVRQFSFEGDTRRLLLYQVDYEDALELMSAKSEYRP